MGAFRDSVRAFVRTGTAFLSALALASFAGAQASLTCDQPMYVPGTTATLTGSGFEPGETVALHIARVDGSPGEAAGHTPWTVEANELGAFETGWLACEYCFGLTLVANADGVESGSHGEADFSLNHDCGDGVVTSVTPVGGACSAFTPAVGNGPDNYEVQEGGTYVMTITGVTECVGDTITVFVQGGSTGNFCFNATGGAGTYSGEFTMSDPACFTYPVSYKCGANAACTHPGSFAAQGPTSGCGGVHLRASTFDGGCNPTGEDEECDGCDTCTLVCPADAAIDCGDSTDPSNTGSPTGCAGATHEDDVAEGNCDGNYVITRTWSAVDDCGETHTCTQTITVTDTTPPTITCPPEVTMTGCCVTADIGEPDVSDDCSDVTVGNDAPDTFCVGTTVVTWTAMDECGNMNSCQQLVTVNDITFDFEVDSLDGPLLHGQRLDTVGPEAPFTCLTITAGSDPLTPGNGNNGAAIFDSTNGPFNQDPDLGVGLGNVLYVQRNGGVSDGSGANDPDCWDIPNDDEDGGSLIFTFCGSVQPSSIDLIDIDAPAPAQDCYVILTDGNANTRTYTVPGAWTDNGPGAAAVGTLLLNATGSQPGFAANATESTDAGYDDTNVVQIEVRLGSSGAVDNLRCCPTAPKATVASRNGAGMNPGSLSSASFPVIGASFTAELDCSAFATGTATVEVRRQANAGQLSPFGEVLIGGQRVYRSVRPFTRTSQPFPPTRVGWSIPHDVTLAGLELHVQGLCQGTLASSGPKLLHYRAQLSNALDLVLGY